MNKDDEILYNFYLSLGKLLDTLPLYDDDVIDRFNKVFMRSRDRLKLEIWKKNFWDVFLKDTKIKKGVQ